MELTFSGIGIQGLAAAVPAQIIDNRNYLPEVYTAQEAHDIVEKTGILERRFAPPGMCASDLCYAAAERLLQQSATPKEDIGLLIFVSQTPDYRMPATGVVLQQRLGLSKATAAFDLNLGCSAFVYGLAVAYGLLQASPFKKALLLDGETRSRVYSPKDRKTAFLFGDGGVAALLEKNEHYGHSFFSLLSDGAKADLIKMNAGGYRQPSTPETLQEKVVDEHGNIRSEEHGYMNGADVFNFVLQEIPTDFKRILEWSGNTQDSIDYFLFHQANSYMNSYLAKKLKLDLNKVPSCLDAFGNTSSVSIPLTLVSRLQGQLAGRKKLLLSGFGVGMSWASAVLETVDCLVPDLLELEHP